MRRTALLIAAAGLLLATPVALADRDGDGPVRTSRILKTLHTEFTLPGAGWAQVVGALGGTPIVGEYSTQLSLPSGAGCRLDVAVDSKTQGVYPRVGRRIIRMTPNTVVPVTYTRTGRHGSVRWWTGTQEGAPAAVAVQPVPRALRSRHRRWIVTLASTGLVAAPADLTACRSRVRARSASTVSRIVRTLSLADGPAVSAPPFAPA